MKKTTTINGIDFEFKKMDSIRNRKTNIFDLYDKPSNEKIKIFNEWNEKINIYGLIGGSSMFSIYGSIQDEKGLIHNVKITKAHNYIID